MEENQKEKILEAQIMQPFRLKTLRKQGLSVLNDFDSNWLITLSDVLSLLLLLFVVFTVMTRNAGATVPKESRPNPHETSALSGDQDTAATIQKKMVEEMNADIKRLELENEVFVHAADKEVVISMKEKVTFRPGEAEPLQSSEPILDNIALIIQQHPLFQVEIEGHTDNVPIRTHKYPSNWELSVARATNVLKYFIMRHEIDPSRLSVKGNADQKPLVQNDTQDNRARNRRVEIRLKENSVQSGS